MKNFMVLTLLAFLSLGLIAILYGVSSSTEPMTPEELQARKTFAYQLHTVEPGDFVSFVKTTNDRGVIKTLTTTGRIAFVTTDAVLIRYPGPYSRESTGVWISMNQPLYESDIIITYVARKNVNTAEFRDLASWYYAQ
jgi:hypothetical protein